MTLNALFACFIAFCLGTLAFGAFWGLILAVAATIVVVYWDKIANKIQIEFDKWRD